MADFIEGYTGYVGEVNTPAKVAAQGETPEEKAAKAAKHAKDLEDAKAALHREQEATADPGARYTMLKLDRDDLEVALQRAEAAGDEVEQLKIKTELLGKNKAISEAEKAIHDVAKKAEPKKPAATKYTSEHVDSLSSAGLFTSEGAVSNPLLDVGRQQLDVLK
jgi:soluble cytochrome b562